MRSTALPAFVLGGLAMVAAACLTGITGSAPAQLWEFASILIGGGLGITMPSLAASSPTAPSASVVAPAAAAAPPVAPVAPVVTAAAPVSSPGVS